MWSSTALLLASQIISSVVVHAQSTSTNSTSTPIYSSNHVPVVGPNSTEGDRNYSAPVFPLLGFEQYANNPILRPNPANGWESAYLFNPGAIVIDDMVWLLYRAQNLSLVSTIGLAWSKDGFNFTRYNKPVLYPTEPYESHGTEDPRIIRVNGTFYVTYTAFDGQTARLALATSQDLVHWKKYGPILPDCTDVIYRFDQPMNEYRSREGWSKSGAIIPEKINGLCRCLKHSIEQTITNRMLTCWYY